MTVAEYDELLPARVVDHARRRRVFRRVVVLLVVAAVVAAGVWWRQTEGDRAHKRAEHRYQQALPAAQAAWPVAEARIKALTPPPGWTVDPTETACTPSIQDVVCWRADVPDSAQARTAAVAVLTTAGATVGDPLRDLQSAAEGDGYAGCPGNPGCPAFLTWDGASIQVDAVSGLDAYGIPAGVLIARGTAYGETPGAGMATWSPAVGKTIKDVRVLTGLPATMLAAATCDAPATSGCLSWRATFDDPRSVAELVRDVISILDAHGFRITQAGPTKSPPDQRVWAWRYREAGRMAPADLVITVRPDGHGGSTSQLTIGNAGLPAPR